MISPDAQIGDCSIEALRFEGQLTLGAILVQAHQRMKVAALQPWRVFHGYQGVGVAGVAHHQHLALAARHIIQCPSLQGYSGA